MIRTVSILGVKTRVLLVVGLLLVTLGGCIHDSPRKAAGGIADAGDVDAGDVDAGSISPVILSRPTDSSISVTFVPQADVQAFVEYGTTSGVLGQATPSTDYPSGKPGTIDIAGLRADQEYFYRVRWRSPMGSSYETNQEHFFHTSRVAGQPFTFTVQADPHLDDKSNLALYHVALSNQLEDGPDFMIDLGDTFMCEKHSAPLTATVRTALDDQTVVDRYRYELGNFGLVAHSVPLFLVNGNHEGEAGWMLNGSENNVAVWASLARNAYFAPPLPGGFYSGSRTEEPFVGRRNAFYSWEWGDALFIVLDPYWYTTRMPMQDGWVWTLGREQYDWLVSVLTASRARFRFVFIHNLVGGADSQARGGMEAASFYEWGGNNVDGTPGFDTKRPGWGKPIHQLLVENHVNAVFHGHDHVYVKQEMDGIVYQETPQPSSPNFNSGPILAAEGHYTSGSILSSSGHLRIVVEQDAVSVSYVRAYRPEDERGQRSNRNIDHTYTMLPR